MTKMCSCVEKSIQAAINKGDSEVEIVFSDGHHPLVPLEDAVNEIQDLLRASGFQVTKNRNVLSEQRGESAVFPFSLKVKWGWEITTKKEKAKLMVKTLGSSAVKMAAGVIATRCTDYVLRNLIDTSKKD